MHLVNIFDKKLCREIDVFAKCLPMSHIQELYQMKINVILEELEQFTMSHL